MAKDDRFDFPETTKIPKDKVLLGRGRKMVDAIVKAYLQDHAGEWMFVREVETAIGVSEDDVIESANKLGYHAHHSVHTDTLERIVQFTKK